LMFLFTVIIIFLPRRYLIPHCLSYTKREYYFYFSHLSFLLACCSKHWLFRML
jgi:hypothetical protein